MFWGIFVRHGGLQQPSAGLLNVAEDLDIVCLVHSGLKNPGQTEGYIRTCDDRQFRINGYTQSETYELLLLRLLKVTCLIAGVPQYQERTWERRIGEVFSDKIDLRPHLDFSGDGRGDNPAIDFVTEWHG